MRSILSVLLVFLFATMAAAQFGNKPGLRNADRPGDDAAPPADKAQPQQPADAANPAAAEPDMVGSILAAMDVDKDGIVTKIEFNKAMAALRKVRKDPKGNMVVPDGATPATPPVAGVDPNQGALGGQPPGAAGAAGRGNEAMARFTQFDRNRDGVLTADEVTPQDRAMLQGADLNNDGAIDARELQMFSRRMGDRMRAWAGGVDPKSGAGVPGDGGRRPPRQ
jgi:hypothetical protein